MIAYQTDGEGVYVGTVVCDESPLEPGVFLIPAGATTVEPPTVGDGEFAVWDGSEWQVPVPSEPDPDPELPMTWERVRDRRDHLLSASDWTQVADAPVDAQAWADYRQALRDIPQTQDDPDSIVWPEAP